MCLLIRTAGPQKVLVISGLGYSKPKFQKGGRVFQIPCLHTVSKLKLNVMTINIESHNVNCKNGVQISVEGVAQCKVQADTDKTIFQACQHFLNMKEKDINQVLVETLEGHQRSIISSMSVEEVFRERELFASKVYDCATPDLMGMGIFIISYTISSISTSNGYLAALGKPSIALVHRDARIGEAKCVRDSCIATAEANKERDEKVWETKLEMEKMTNSRDLTIEANKKSVNTVKAIAQNAARKARAHVDQTLVHETMTVKVIQRKGQARVMDEELKFQEKRLEATTKLTAETDKFLMEVKATADKKSKILLSEAEAISIAAIGEAEAEAINKKSAAEARATSLKAKAYEQFGKAALVGEVIKMLPNLAAEVARPTTEANKFTIVSSGDGQIGMTRIVNEIMTVMNQVPDGINDMTGIDLKHEIQKVMKTSA